MLGQLAHAGSTDIANVPMAVSNMVTPNVLVIYDNSQSMDAYMNGTLVSGNNPNTRGNIGREVMRAAIDKYRTTFNWGLMTYETSDLTLRNTHAYFMGDNAGMNFTNDCKDTGGVSISTVFVVPPLIGRSASNGNRRCIPNPQPAFGANYITYDVSGDDPNILDVLYSTQSLNTNIWALTSAANSSNYNLWFNRIGGGWTAGDFNSFWFNGSFTPTDAGYLPYSPTVTRQVYIPRGWGYTANISGKGSLNESVTPDSTTHYTTLQNLLGSETNGTTSEVKNGALFTPLNGTLQSAKSYFSSAYASKTSPVLYSCQQNFVMLVTDGLPTGNTSGNLYSDAARTNSCAWSTSSNSCTSGSFGTAATDAIAASKALRTASVTGKTSTNKDGTGAVTGKYDVQTYVVALGETVANANALSVMNAMAYNGGTDSAIPANDADSFKNAINAISDSITAKVGSAAAVAVANAHVTSSDNASFASSYNSGTWAGDLNSNAINVTTGIVSTTSLWTAGSAATQLDLRTPASRLIATSTDVAGATGGLQFQPTTATSATKLSTAQQTLLNTSGKTDGAAVLAYLRGDRTCETAGACTVTYRARAHLLGDMINGEPVVVGVPNASYSDAGYTTFKSDNASRTRMLYQGANDGMLHAFVASSGAESWAYVPNLVIANLNKLILKSGFSHIYYVDSTPAFGDVDFNNIDSISSSGDWRTILVGGLGKGGNGYYALDVTSGTAASEVDVKNKVLWEFPNSITSTLIRAGVVQNMGYAYSQPIIVKTSAKGWVVLVTSGYNNGTNSGDSGGDGLGHLFVLNPKTGNLIADITTPGCTTSPASNPCGLAQVSASISSNGTVDYIYGGDLYGNLWRFDLTNSSVMSWSATIFATLKDSLGATQPITAAPTLSVVDSKRMVQIGTGKYFGNTDVTGTTGANAAASQTQTIYGLRDALVALPTTPSLRANLQQQTYTNTSTTRTMSSNAVDYTTKKGWYIDLGAGERVNTQCGTSYDNLVCTTNIPNAIKCEPGGSSWEFILSSKTGSLANRSIETTSAVFLGNVLASRPVTIQNESGQDFSLVRLSDATTKTIILPPPPPPPPSSTTTIKRTWRQLFLY
ncbi:MAG: PilC/PilY family type IV pilus protein [Rhodoferax sp.]|uniref:pilus assembly protein n=1 Tax=Rhodoferax sp. TaxID=50421 RepID=UPI003017824A